jgi:hypothetical protein
LGYEAELKNKSQAVGELCSTLDMQSGVLEQLKEELRKKSSNFLSTIAEKERVILELGTSNSALQTRIQVLSQVTPILHTRNQP